MHNVRFGLLRVCQGPVCVESVTVMMSIPPATGEISTGTPASAMRGTAMRPTTATLMTSAQVSKPV